MKKVAQPKMSAGIQANGRRQPAAAGRGGPVGVIQRLYDLENNSLANKAKMNDLDAAVADLDRILLGAGIQYVIQGSMAQAMHGAGLKAVPGDIDVLVPNPKGAGTALTQSGLFTLQSNGMLVTKVRHTATQVMVDLVQNEDFGMSQASVAVVNGKRVLSVFETLRSLLLRPEKRQKDHISFISLLVQKGDELSQQEKATIAQTAGSHGWQQLYDYVFEEYKKIVMG
ncbi:MAG TPA: hypothetical protein VGX48_21515 [Pyrinomonadaceae bacterium]|nr:hypothetical protein [Pyrinomonadaceae bacterium]